MLIQRRQGVYGNTIRNEPTLDASYDIIDFPVNNSNNASLRFK